MNDRERLHRYFDGELPENEKQAFDANADHEAKEKLLALEDVRRAVKTTVDLQTANLDLVSGINRELDRQAAQLSWRRRARWASPVAAIAAAAAAFMIWMKPPAPITPMATREAASIESLEVQGAMASIIDLEDEHGSATVIWIDEDEKETL